MRTSSDFSRAAEAAPLPGPRGVPYFGSYFDVVADRLGLFTDGRDRFGDLVRYRFGPFRFVVLNDPDAIHHVFVRHHARYVKSRSYDGLRLVMGNGLVTSEGDFWKRQRKLSQPAFHRKRLVQLADTMSGLTEELATQWSEEPEQRVDLHDAMMRLTLRIVGHTLFSTELSAEAGRLGPAITTALHRANQEAEAAIRLPLWLPTPGNLKFHRAQRTLDEAIGRIIAERRANPGDRGDLLSMLMSVEDELTAEQMTDQQLRDEVLTLFLAGHETIATHMSWTWKLLAENPQWAKKVRDEAHAVLGGSAPTFEDLPRLEVAGRVISESMRLYPPVWIFERTAVEDDVVCGRPIAKDTIVAACPWTLHRHPALWSDPLRFDPDRFLPERVAQRHRYAYIPFGAGPRICIGNNFALMEAKIILTTLMQRFDIDVDDPANIGLDAGVTLRPEGGMPGRVRAL